MFNKLVNTNHINSAVATYEATALVKMCSLRKNLACHQRRRLVINIVGGKNFGLKYWGGQKFRENIFSDNILKKF